MGTCRSLLLPSARFSLVRGSRRGGAKLPIFVCLASCLSLAKRGVLALQRSQRSAFGTVFQYREGALAPHATAEAGQDVGDQGWPFGRRAYQHPRRFFLVGGGTIMVPMIRRPRI